MKRILSVLLSVLLLLAVSACQQQTSSVPSEDLSVSSELPVQMPSSSEQQAADPSESEESSSSVPEPSSIPEETNRILIAYFSLADIVPEGVDAISSATPSVGNPV